MAELWEAMLGIENVGRDDDFFELGGDSLAGIRLVNRANDAFDAALRIADLFENPTVATLARAAVASSAAAPAPPIPRRAPTPVPEESNA